jgi:hypothetical protein
MSGTGTEHGPAAYEIRIGGHLDPRWSAWFGDLAMSAEADGTTTLTGVMADQSALHGLLSRVRDLGVPLISVALVGR